MPAPGMRWRLVTIGTHNAWRPGDPRGWRSRNHKRHSSGDYRNPPPPNEHEGLRHWVNQRAGEPVIIARPARCTIGEAVVEALAELKFTALAVSVSGMLCHMVVELPDDPKVIKPIIGEVKRASSRAVSRSCPDASGLRAAILNQLIHEGICFAR
jgi:hypothetical protein